MPLVCYSLYITGKEWERERKIEIFLNANGLKRATTILALREREEGIFPKCKRPQESENCSRT